MTILDNFEAVLTYLEDTQADAELIEFISGRIAQEKKARDAAAERRKANGGEKKDPAMSEFYTKARETLTTALTAEFQTGDELVSASGAKTNNDKPLLAPQVATALKPLVESGEVVVDSVIREYTDSKGLVKQASRKAYKLA